MQPLPSFRLQIAVFAVFSLSVIAPLDAQAFADLKSALVDYSKSDVSPHKACDAMVKFKTKEIVEIHAVAIPALVEQFGVAPPITTPAHCRVTGILSPEIAFEVSLPEKWNGR